MNNDLEKKVEELELALQDAIDKIRDLEKELEVRDDIIEDLNDKIFEYESVTGIFS